MAAFADEYDDVIPMALVSKNSLPQPDCPSFKMLSLKELKLLLSQGFWTTTLDLLDAYRHVPIPPNKRSFLGFHYKRKDNSAKRKIKSLSKTPYTLGF